MVRRVPEGPPPPPIVARVRVRYVKRGRLRFTSHRDFARALERALRRADVPIAFSAGFSPHPKISYIGAAPTGVSSDAEYLELALSRHVDIDDLRVRLDAALPDGIDIADIVPAGPGGLAERIEASAWRIELASDDVHLKGIATAVDAFLATDAITVERLTRDGRREIDARGPVVSIALSLGSFAHDRAILDMVVRQAAPSIRPDDVLAALQILGAQLPSVPPRATRLAQGPLGADGVVEDPLAADRVAAAQTS